ncbi:MAG TPA: DNA polymerase I [Isosphaeraceae bacterium]|jgi:DNA polymerase-1|nr:DNA polymerase I [Isosphaeraceae bacterium]
MEPRPTLYILDAYSLIYQVFHAIPTMTGPAGQPTNAVFGIFRDLLNLVHGKRPEYLIAAFDGGGPVTRSEIYPEYKAQRGPMPDDLRPQIAVLRRLFEAFGVPVLMAPGAEADDVIATVARGAESRDMDVFICTSDKDARQLLSDRVRILNLRKKSVLDVEGLAADWGVAPAQVVDFLALTGDSVDNVPGVPGIGPVGAKALLKEFGTLENLLASASKVKGPAKQKALREHADAARLARRLVTLDDAVDIPLDWEALRYKGYDARALKALCDECGFHGFVHEIVDDAVAPEAPWSFEKYQIIDTPEKLRAFVADLSKRPKFCLDTETTGLDPLRAELVGLSFSWHEGEAYYLPVRGPLGGKVLDRDETLAALKPILADEAREKVGQNLKYDMLVLGRAGLEVIGPVTDTMVLSYLLESGERNHNLDELARRLLDHTMIPISDLIGKGKKQRSIDQIDIRRVADYAGEDADAAWRIEAILAPKVKAEGLWDLYADLERPLIGVLARMERVGIKVDVARLGQLSAEFAGRLDAIEAQVHAIAGRPFNIGSAAQLRQVLFDELKLPVVSRTPGGEPSTAADVLEELAAKHELPRLLIQHRQLSKLKSTYLDTLPNLVNPDDGRVHASFNQGVAATGRLSSSDPNLQNIPVRTEDGRQVRQAFVAGAPGWSLLTADYSQIELRILAHYSKDPALVRAFAEDRDIHSVVAARIFHVPENEVTSAQRRVAKTVNFGVIYGLSPFGLAARLGISQTEAAAFIDAYFQEYAGVDSFITKTLEAAQQAGRVETILGRRRAIDGIKSTTGHNRNLAERTAVNTVIQGSAADLIKRAMLAVDDRLRRELPAARMLLQIHDELVLEAPEGDVPTLAVIVREAMTTALDLDVPLQVDLAAGPNWLDVSPLP